MVLVKTTLTAMACRSARPLPKGKNQKIRISKIDERNKYRRKQDTLDWRSEKEGSKEIIIINRKKCMQSAIQFLPMP